MRNRVVKQLLMVCMATTLSVSVPVVSWGADETSKIVENNDDSEKESIYQQAYQEIKENYSYDKAEELLKKIEGYKDSSELIDHYEKMKTTRLIDGKFYWQPQEYVQILKQNLLSLEDNYTNIDVTGGTTTPEDGTTDTITISYSDGTVEVLLQNVGFNSNNDAESFGKIKVQGIQGELLAYPAATVIATVSNNHSIDTAREVLSKLTDLNPHGEFSQDGLKYIFNNDGTTISFEIEPEEEKSQEGAEPTATPEPTEVPEIEPTQETAAAEEATPKEEPKPVVEYKDVTTIRIVQQALNDAGYNCGNPDGVAGGKTTEAVTKYQTDKGLTVNGLVTDELLQALDVVEKVQDAVQKEASKGEYSGDYTYDQLARNPDTYTGNKIKISGKVLQADSSGDICYARVAMNNSYDTVIFVTYDKDLLGYRLLEDDKITVYGTSLGVYSYEAVSGATITIPWLNADMIEM